MVTYVRRVLLDSTELIDCSGARSIRRMRLLLVRSEVHRSVRGTSSYDNAMTRHSVIEYVYAVFVYEK